MQGSKGRERPVEERDLTLDNQGVLGYTAADFQEAILGDSEQLLTYKGTATYTVDLGELSRDDISLDEEEMTVHVKIPHAVLEPININEEDIEFGDVERGLLGVGKIEMDAESLSKIQSEARNKMMEKLEEQKSAEEADRFARMSVWEIYQPIIDAVTTGYSLEVEFE